MNAHQPFAVGILAGLVLFSPVLAGDPPDAASAGQTLRAARDDVLAKWKSVHSLTATISSNTHIEYDDGYTDIIGLGRYEFLHKDGVDYVRTNIKLTVANRTDQQIATDRSRITTYDDGEIMYTVREKGDVQSVTMEKVIDRSAMDAIWVFETMPKYHELKRLDDTRLAEGSVYVIQGTPKDDEMPISRIAVYLSKATGAVEKYERYNKEGELYSTTTYSDIVLNPKLEVERFVFKPTEGMEVTDLSESGSSQPVNAAEKK